MSQKPQPFNWNSIRNLFLALLFLVISLPLILVLFLSLGYKEPTQAAKKPISKQNTTDQTTTPPGSQAKIVLINPNGNSPALTSEYNEENETNPIQNQPANPPPASLPPTSPPASPPPSATCSPQTEYIGTATKITGNVLTFSYGNGCSMDVTLTKSSPSSFRVGTRAHVHVQLSGGKYVEDEIEILSY